MATAGDQINAALRLIGKLAEGETASSETSADALTALNQMLDAWSIESLPIYREQDQTFTWAASAASKTLGPTGDFVGVRPITVKPSTFFRVSGIDYPLIIITRAEYSSFVDKDAESSLPLFLFPT